MNLNLPSIHFLQSIQNSMKNQDVHFGIVCLAFFCLFHISHAKAAPGATPVVDTTINAPLTGDNAGSAPAGSSGLTGDPALAFGSNVITITNESTLQGGDGGTAGAIVDDDSKTGGQGGSGVSFNNQDGSSNSLRPVLINNASGNVIGGNGGLGLASVDPGSGGLGGSGIQSDANYALINNYGTVMGGVGGTSDGGGRGGAGIELSGTDITVNNFGTVTGGTGGVGTSSPGGGGYGVDSLGSGNVVNNYGTINAGVPNTTGAAGRAVSMEGTLNNTGTINGSIFGSGGISIINEGAITGAISTSTGNDTITQNGGTLTATSIQLSSGSNTVNIHGGTISGNITVVGTSTDYFTMTGGTYTGTANLGNGANFLNISGGTVNGALTTGTGVDTFTLSGGTVTGVVNLGTGNDILILSGGSLGSTLNMGTGTDTISFVSDYTLPTSFSVSGAETYQVDNGGTLSFESARSLDSGIEVNSGGRVNIASGNLSAVTSLVNNGTIFLGAGRQLTSSIDNYDTGHYIFEVNSAASAGRMTISSGSIIMQSNSISVEKTADAVLADNNEILIGTGTSQLLGFDGNAGQALTVINDNSFFWDFFVADGSQAEITTSSNNAELYLLVNEANTLASASNSTNNSSLVETLNELFLSSASSEINAIETRIDSVASAEELNDVLESLLPTLNNSSAIVNSFFSNTVSQQVSGRMSHLRQPDTSVRSNFLSFETSGSFLQGTSIDPTVNDDNFKKALHDIALGIESSSTLFENNSLWVQGFGSKINQGEVNEIEGFNSNVYGATLGADFEIWTGNYLGIALSFADADVDSEDANNTQSDIETYQVSVYGNSMLEDQVYINGSVSYAWSEIDLVRSDVGGVSLTSFAEYTSQNYGVSAAIGKEYAVGENAIFDLSGLVNYKYFDAYEYTEEGAGGASLNIEKDSSQLLELGFNLDVSSDFKQENGSIMKPSFTLGYRYDLIGDTVATSSNFIAGGASFQSDGKNSGRGTATIGAGISYISDNNWDLSTEYGYDHRDNYNAHSAQITSRWRF